MPKTRHSRNRVKDPNALRKISKRVLQDRLALENDSSGPPPAIALPAVFPQSMDRQLSQSQVKSIENDLDVFVKLGCYIRVLYWCLQQIGPAADRRRAGQNTVQSETQPIATRQHMDGLLDKVKGAEEIIFRYKRELLLAADVLGDTYPYPSGWLTNEPPLSSEGMQVLFDSLSWVKRLAESWQAPNVQSLVKSTGILFLLSYVWIHTKKSPTRLQLASRTRKIKLYRLTNRDAKRISDIADRFCGVYHTVGDLNDKLQNFQEKRPDLFESMVGLLEILDREALTSSHM